MLIVPTTKKAFPGDAFVCVYIVSVFVFAHVTTSSSVSKTEAKKYLAFCLLYHANTITACTKYLIGKAILKPCFASLHCTVWNIMMSCLHGHLPFSVLLLCLFFSSSSLFFLSSKCAYQQLTHVSLGIDLSFYSSPFTSLPT